MKNKVAVLALVLATISLGISLFRPAATVSSAGAAVEKKKETADERVMRTGVIRCGYVVYPPYINWDPNTKKLSGVYYDYTEKLASMVGMKVDWAHETTYPNMTAEMESGKYDVFCGGLWPDANQAKVLDYSIPTNFSGIGVYVRSNDNRFDGHPELLNNPKYKFATIDGDTSEIVLKTDFEKASKVSMPAITEITQLAENVKSGKADATIIGEVVANEYMAANPGALKNIYAGHPIRVYENLWAFPGNSPRLTFMFNTAIKEMLYSGVIDKITAKYTKKPNDFYPVAIPYTPVKGD